MHPPLAMSYACFDLWVPLFNGCVNLCVILLTLVRVNVGSNDKTWSPGNPHRGWQPPFSTGCGRSHKTFAARRNISNGMRVGIHRWSTKLGYGNQLRDEQWRRQDFSLGSRIEAPRGRGTEGAKGVGCGEGPRRGLCPLPRKIFNFGAQNGKFWCILATIFTGQLPVLSLHTCCFLLCVCVCCGCYLSVSVCLSSCNFSKQFILL